MSRFETDKKVKVTALKQPDGFDYDAFATYATDPDVSLVRATEAFIEAFHRRRTLPDAFKVPLELCVDGRDFAIPRRRRDNAVRPEQVADIVEGYLRRSRALLVLCGPESKAHPWINYEINWWLRHRPDSPIYFAVSHGASSKPADSYPDALSQAGGGDLTIQFDLRGFYRTWSAWLAGRVLGKRRLRHQALLQTAHQWNSVRPFEEELARITARLLSDALGSDTTPAQIVQAWEKDERRARMRQMVAGALALVVASALMMQIVSRTEEATLARQAEKIEQWLNQAQVKLGQGRSALTTALAYAASAVKQRPDAEATRIAIATANQLAPIHRILKPDGGDPAWTALPIARGDSLLVGGRSSILRHVDVAGGHVLRREELKMGGIRHLAHDSATRTTFVGTDRGLVILANWTDRTVDTPVRIDPPLPRTRIGGLAIDSARQRLLIGYLSGEIWEVPTDPDRAREAFRQTTIFDPRFATDQPSDITSGVNGMRISRNELVVTGIDGVISILPLANLKQSPAQIIHPHSIFGMDTAKNAPLLGVADQNGGVSLYDLDKRTLLRSEPVFAGSQSVARAFDGTLKTARVRRRANVGLSIDDRGTMLAVTSHDRTVRFLSLPDLVVAGMAIHERPPRDVVFESDDLTAYSFSDDGSIQVVRPAAHIEAVRIGSAASFVSSPDGKIFAWPPKPAGQAGYGRPKPVSTPIFELTPGKKPMLGPENLHVPFHITLGAYVHPHAIAIRGSSETTQVRLLPAGSTPIRCDRLPHRNEPDHVQLVRKIWSGRQPNELVTLTEWHGKKAFTLNVWNTEQCELNKQFETSGIVSVARSALAYTESPRMVSVIRGTAGSADAVIKIPLPGIIRDLSISEDARRLLAITGEPPAVCLCEGDQSPGPAVGACATTSSAYRCKDISGQKNVAASIVGGTLSKSGLLAVLNRQQGALVWASEQNNWQIRSARSAQIRPGLAPHAISTDESYIAVPDSNRGIRVVRTADATTVARLPTSGNVKQLAFSQDTEHPTLISLDADVIRVWDWQPGKLLNELCERWNPEVAIQIDSQRAPAPLGREEICN